MRHREPAPPVKVRVSIEGDPVGPVNRLAGATPDQARDRVRRRLVAMHTPDLTPPGAVPGFAIAWLRAHRIEQAERRLPSPEWEATDLVFDGGVGEACSVESVSRRFGQLVEQVGLGEVRLNDLRHAFATRLLEGGVHPKVVSEAMGHASVGITLDTYSHVGPSLSGDRSPGHRGDLRGVIWRQTGDNGAPLRSTGERFRR